MSVRKITVSRIYNGTAYPVEVVPVWLQRQIDRAIPCLNPLRQVTMVCGDSHLAGLVYGTEPVTNPGYRVTVEPVETVAQCRATVRVVCRLNGAHSGIFTDGKTYEAKHHLNALYEVKDDFGYERYIIPGELCPFLKTGGIYSEKCVGRFEVVEPEGGLA